MAEGFARHLKGGEIDVWSAGIEAKGLNPLAVRAMAEVGVDIWGQASKTLDQLGPLELDYVVTVCGHANETCPRAKLGRAKVLHVGFDDPPQLAAQETDDEGAMAHYRRVRDEIRAFVEGLPDGLVQ
jgi:arsenate reductase